MAPPKRTAAAVEANPFEDANANLLAKQKLAAQAHLARASGRRGNAHTHTQNHNTNGHGNGNGLFAQSSGKGLASLADLANMSEAVRTQDGINDATLNWPTEPRPLLLRYRHAFALQTPTPYKNPSAHLILASGIGMRSPTMARERSKRRCTKDETAAAVKKHFKEAGVEETASLVELSYRVKMKDKAFRLKFYPNKR